MDFLPSGLALAAALLVLVASTAVQAALGFGLALLAAPLLHLLDPGFVPGPVIFCVWTLSLWVCWQERHAVDVERVPLLVGGRLAGALLAIAVLGVVSQTAFDVLFGMLVLLAVLLSCLHPQVELRARNLLLATLASGFMETLSGIGGPPLALVYQNAGISRLRANLAAIFLFGASLSLMLLALSGNLGWRELQLALLLQPGVLGGILLAAPLRRRLDPALVRPLLLGLCSVAALSIIIHGLWQLI